MKTSAKKDIFKLVRFGIAALQGIISLIFLYFLSELNMLPMKHFLIIAGVLIGLCIVNVICQIKKVPGIIMMVIGIIISIILGIVCVDIVKTTNVLKKISGAKHQIDSMSVYVLKDDPATTIGDTSGYVYGILADKGRDATDKVLDKIDGMVEGEIQTKEFDDFFTMIDELYAGTIKTVVLNEAYIDIIVEAEGYEDLREKVKALYMTEVKTEVEWYEEDENANLNEDVFTLYISGIDTYGSVAKTSRSDEIGRAHV